MKRPSVTRKYLAHRILSGALCAAVLLSGLVFAPIPAKAAGKTTYYSLPFSSETDLENALTHTSNADFMSTSGAMYQLGGSSTSLKVYRMGNSYDQRTAKDLEFELTKMSDLDTTDLGAVNVSMIYAKNSGEGGINVDYSRELQVKVEVDGEWKDGSVGVRSSKLIGGGWIRTGSSPIEGLFYQIETKNLLDIPGVEKGDTITGIKILPDGENNLSGGNFYIHALDVNTYASLDAFDAECPAEVIAKTSVSGDTLRDIAVAEAVRTAKISRDSYSGPVYAKAPDATREFFQSDTTQGMDCQTFVFNAISRVSRTNAASVQFSLNASRAKLVGGLTPDPIDKTSTSLPQYTDTDIVGVAHTEAASLSAKRVQQIYQNYAAARKGDIAVHHLENTSANNTHTRLVSQDAVVTYINNDPAQGIDGANSYLVFHEQDSTLKWNSTTRRFGYSYIDNKFFFQELLIGKTTANDPGHGCYVVYTLDEYADESENNQIEKASVEAVFGSKTAGENFVSGGLNIAVSSNYRIVSYQVKLFNTTTGSDSLVKNCGLVYPSHGSGTNQDYSHVTGFNYQNSTLDTELAGLSDGTYRIDMIVDSGPLTSVDQDTVPQTTKSVLFTMPSGAITEVYSVSVDEPTNGTVSVDMDSGVDGDTVTVAATPNDGYVLKEILVDGKPIAGTTFKITKDHTVSATFVRPFYGANVDLGNTLDLNFYFDTSYVTDENSYAKIVRTYADGREDVRSLPQGKWKLNENPNYYEFTYDGLAAKEMCDVVSVTIFDSTDTAISETKTTSIRSYAMQVLGKTDTESVAAYTALVDMLNYGAAAQKYFGYATGDLANSELTPEQMALATQSVTCDKVHEKTDNYYGTNLDLESKIRLNFYFTGVTDDMTATVSYTDHTGNEVSVDVKPVKNNSTYQVSVEDLAVADGNTEITCTVYNADDSEYASMTDSINSYVSRATRDNQNEWLEYIAKVSTSAYNYLHSNANN